MNATKIRCVPVGECVAPIQTWNPARDSEQGTFRYIDISGVSQSEKRVTHTGEILTSDAPSRARQLVRAGDVLVSTVRPNLNAVAFVPDEMDAATASTGFCVLRPDNRQLSGRYLFHWVQSPSFVADLVQQATGQSYPAVSDKIIKRSEIPLPPLAEQKRVAAILDQADELRRMRAKTVDMLMQLEVSLLHEILKSTEHSTDVFLLSELAEPSRNSFCNGPFGSNLLTSELQNSGVPVVYIRDIRNGYYERVSASCVSESKARDLSAGTVTVGDLLIAKVGDPPGISAVYPENEPDAIVTQDVIRLRTDRTKADPIFLSALLNSSIGKQSIQKITVNATRARFSLGNLKVLQISMPEVKVQHIFCRYSRRIRENKASAEQQLQKLDSLFSSLQHRAFRGEL